MILRLKLDLGSGDHTESSPASENNDSASDSLWSSPQTPQLKSNNVMSISPIQNLNSFGDGDNTLISNNNGKYISTPHEKDTAAVVQLKRLVMEISEQKNVVLECLENDCDKEELNNHIAVSYFYYFHIFILMCIV